MTQRFHACIIKILAHIYQGNVQVFAAKKKKGISLYVHQLQVEINNVYYIQSWMIYNNENEWITGKKKSTWVNFKTVILRSYRRINRYDSNSIIWSELINIFYKDRKASSNNSEEKPGNKIQLSDYFWQT